MCALSISDGRQGGAHLFMYFDPDQKSGFIVLLNGEPRGRGIDEEILEIMNRAMTASE
jgi:hypothetical protein